MKSALYGEIISLLHLEKTLSYSILDIGCGNGAFLNDLSYLVNSTSRLIGIDIMSTAIETAKAIYPLLEWQQFEFTETLPFSEASFDIVVSIDTLECIVHKDSLIQEIARILRPHGKVVCAHWDWDTQVYHSEHPHLIRHMIHAFAEWKQEWMSACDGLMGRKLWGLFQRSKQFHGRIDVFTLVETAYQEGTYGYERLHDLQSLVEKHQILLDDYDCITQEMQALYERGEYFYSLNSYIYSGEKIEIPIEVDQFEKAVRA